MCCLSKVSKSQTTAPAEELQTVFLSSGGWLCCAVGPSELMLGCVWAKNLELKNARDLISLPET